MVSGKNLSGFEGDKNVWIENTATGVKGIIRGDQTSSATKITFTLADKYCTADTSYSGAACPSYLTITPGNYVLYANPWGVTSNSVTLVVTSSSNTAWQTYTYADSQNNFSIQYPSGWIAQDYKPKTIKDDHTIIFKSPDWTSTKPISFALETWLAEGGRTASAQVAMFSNPTYGAGLEKSSVNIGSIPAVEFISTTDPTMKGSFIIFEKGGYTYTISATNVDQTKYQEFYSSFTITN